MNKDIILREKLALQRTILANQSAFLAFIRTSMYFLIAGISINNLTSIQYGYQIQVLFITISIILLVIGILNFKIQKKKIKESEIQIGNIKDEFLNSK